MPATHFICADGEQISITECLNKGCRMTWCLPAGRCLSVRTLRAIAEQRPWNGKPSTTQLLKGTREVYLEITKDYAINPQDALFRVHGSKAHAFLDQYTGDNELGEERLSDEISSGQFDFYDNGILFDTKTWGSFKVNKALGMYQVEVETGEYYKSGKKKGQPKTRKEWREGGEPDLFNEEMQLNDYRMKLEAIGFPVRQIFIEAIIRDGNTWVASSRGVQQNGILIPVKILPDDVVKEYFTKKKNALLKALDTGELPDICDQRERWADTPLGLGRKCQRYCNVACYCDFAMQERSVS